jgi:hypothetical protein
MFQTLLDLTMHSSYTTIHEFNNRSFHKEVLVVWRFYTWLDKQTGALLAAMMSLFLLAHAVPIGMFSIALLVEHWIPRLALQITSTFLFFVLATSRLYFTLHLHSKPPRKSLQYHNGSKDFWDRWLVMVYYATPLGLPLWTWLVVREIPSAYNYLGQAWLHVPVLCIIALCILIPIQLFFLGIYLIVIEYCWFDRDHW